MKKYVVRFAVSLLAFLIGTAASSIPNSFQKRYQWARVEGAMEGVVLVVLPGPALSQSEFDENLPKDLSPREIEFFINDHPEANLTKLWQALAIDADFFNGTKANSEFFPVKCQNCRAESFDYDLDGQPGTEVLLRIAKPWDYASRFLIFKYVSDSWKLLGHIDASGKYRSPQHTIIVSRGLTWLAIQSQGASGSGVATYFDSVYRVTPKGILWSFSYMADGSQYGGPNSANREFNGRILDCSLTNNVVHVEIEYSVTYVGGGNILFRKKQKGVFDKGLGDQPERFDRDRSSLSQEELEAVYNIDSLSSEAFLKYNYRELSEIAAGRDVAQKDWLREFLKDCENTIEHRRLSKMLSQ